MSIGGLKKKVIFCNVKVLIFQRYCLNQDCIVASGGTQERSDLSRQSRQKQLTKKRHHRRQRERHHRHHKHDAIRYCNCRSLDAKKVTIILRRELPPCPICFHCEQTSHLLWSWWTDGKWSRKDLPRGLQPSRPDGVERRCPCSISLLLSLIFWTS